MARKEVKKGMVKPVNLTLGNPQSKITFEFLKAHLWSAANILRASLDPNEYSQPVMTLLFHFHFSQLNHYIK